MISKTEARSLLNDLFEEEALVIGGLIAVHDMDDDFVWRLVKNLDVIRSKMLRRLEDSTQPKSSDGQSGHSKLKPHPAIEEFLLKLKRA